jgi:ribulose-phosphate 3-epimerase
MLMVWRDRVRTVEIEPSLYAADFSRLGEQIDNLLNAGARVFHFDVGDGHFVEPVTIGPIVLSSISRHVHERGGALDCHLMVENPQRHFKQIADAGGDSVTFHVEVVDDPAATMALAREFGLGAGVAFNPETPVDDAVAASEGADLVLCMSIHPGYSGQAFMTESLERIQDLRVRVPSDVHVQVDGGVTSDNAAEIRDAGANLIVAGSAIFDRGDLPRAYQRLVRALA